MKKPGLSTTSIELTFYQMLTKNTNTSRQFARFFAAGILLSMITVYLLHFFGSWESGVERRDVETTSSVIVTNKCAVLGDTHILRPSSSSSTTESNRELKFAGSFMNFFDGHILVMIIVAAALAAIMFLMKKTANPSPPKPSYS